MLTIKKIYDDLEGDIIILRVQKNSFKKIKKMKKEALENYLNTSKIGLNEYMEIKRYQDVMRIIKPKHDDKTRQTLLK